jgi:hypothetical protein
MPSQYNDSNGDNETMNVPVRNNVVKRTYYTSNKPGTFIRNALTGREYEWKVGTPDSLRLFKVVDTIGNHDKNGCRIINSNKRRGVTTIYNSEPNHLYYDTPEEFMRHRNCRIHKDLILQWTEKRNHLFPVEIRN